MATADARDRLQPALLDRLSLDGAGDIANASEGRALTKQQLRQSVLRDLSWLFNATQSLRRAEIERHPELAASVLAYGLPPLAGELASKLDIAALERTIRDTILRFEPRILADTLKVRAVEVDNMLEAHNRIEFVIAGHLWSQPVPLEILLRTQVDLEAGQVEVVDAQGTAPARMRGA
jgi:type VI secretion system protein ImpF